MARKFKALFNIFTYLAKRSITLIGTSSSFQRIKFRTNQRTPEVVLKDIKGAGVNTDLTS